MLSITRFTNFHFNSNTYVFFDDNSEDSAYLIDCGDIAPIKKYLAFQKKRLKAVFITHSHFDHIYGLNNLIELFPDISLYASEYGVKGLYDSKLNLSEYYDNPFVYKNPNYIVISNNQIIRLDSNIEIKCYYTPGHDKSSLTFHLNNYALFTGDSYIPEIKTIVSFPSSNRVEEKKSYEFIGSLIGDISVICPGHNKELYLK